MSIKKESTWENIKDALIKFSNYPDFGYKNVYGYIREDTNKVRAWKACDKNLTLMFQHDHEVIRVDSQRDYERVKKGFDALGSVRRLVIFGMWGFGGGGCGEVTDSKLENPRHQEDVLAFVQNNVNGGKQKEACWGWPRNSN